MMKVLKAGAEIDLSTYRGFVKSNKEALQIMYANDDIEAFEEYCSALWQRMSGDSTEFREEYVKRMSKCTEQSRG